MTADLTKIVELARQIVELATEPEPTPAPVPAPPSGDAAILTNYGMVNTAALVAASIATGVPLWVAAAFVEKESNGRNIYGNDTGGTFAGAGAVTEDNYREFYRLVVEEKQKSNGVGPMQITYPAYFPKAAAEGLQLWVPLDNYTFGLRIIAANLRGDYTVASLERTGTLYNAGNLTNGINAYGRDVALKAAKWAARLGVTLPPEPTPAPVPAPAPAPEPEPKVGDTIREGDQGEAVTEAQKRLTAHGFPEPRDGIPNGIFGSRMTLQTKAFQTANGLTVDGVIGPQTWVALAVKSDSEMRAEVLAILYANGWKGAPSHTQAIKDFQAAVAFTNRALVVDGVVGPVTYNAALEFKRRGGKLSDNFTAMEFQCRCNDKYPDCRRVWVKRSLLFALEKYRTRIGQGVRVVSGCRCPGRNAETPNAYEYSQHTLGRGCDVDQVLTPDQVKALGVFSGIGYARSTGKVMHLDVRADEGPDRVNAPVGTITTPRVFPEAA